MSKKSWQGTIHGYSLDFLTGIRKMYAITRSIGFLAGILINPFRFITFQIALSLLFITTGCELPDWQVPNPAGSASPGKVPERPSVPSPSPIPSPSSTTQGTGPTALGTGQAISNVLITFYGFDDNDDGFGHYGNATISNPGIHPIATEDLGTYDRPSTFATDTRLFKPGSRIYIPKFRKYYIMEDTCRACTADYDQGEKHIDLFIGSNTQLQGTDLYDCQNFLTGDAQFDSVVIQNPGPTWPVSSQKLYSNGVCSNQIFPYPSDSGRAPSSVQSVKPRPKPHLRRRVGT
jgi:3D (Asp-Asp-Asp) domain-containing protein